MNKHQCEYCPWFSEIGVEGLGRCEAPRVMKDQSCRKAKERKLKEEGSNSNIKENVQSISKS